MEEYAPPFEMSVQITDLIFEIGHYMGTLSNYELQHPSPVLRKENQIRSIHSSLAIEHNTLSLEQVTDLIDGKRVLGPPKDIQEVKNAFEVYDLASSLNPYNMKDLLKAHKLMMNSLVKEAGMFRSGNVGVYSGSQLIHAGSPAHYVPELMDQLFRWLKKTSYHPLIKSCLFHYEFVFIHPFADGNGRTGRLWQSLILQNWNPLFTLLPVETLVHENQADYYKAIQLANNAGDATIFVAFMLGIIRDALREVAENQNKQDEEADVTPNVRVNVTVNVRVNEQDNDHKLLALLSQDGHLSARVLASTLGLTERQVRRILARLKEEKKIIRHGAAKNGWWEVL